MARGPLHLVVNITVKTLYTPEQDTALKFCGLIFLVIPKEYLVDCGSL